MTIKEFYDWAVSNGLQDYEIEIQHRSGAGWHSGRDYLNELEIEVEREQKTVVL